NEASDFRFGSMEASRLEKQKESIKKTWENSTYLILLWLYRVASGFGERVGQAILVFFLLLFVFFLANKAAHVTPPVTQPPRAIQTVRKLGWREAAVYSLEAAFLQKPEPKPLTNWGRLLVLFE